MQLLCLGSCHTGSRPAPVPEPGGEPTCEVTGAIAAPRSRSRSLVAVVGGAFVASQASATVKAQARGFDGTTIKVASLGFASQVGTSKVGAQARIQRFNDDHEIKGVKLEYVGFSDDKNDPATALVGSVEAGDAGPGVRPRCRHVELQPVGVLDPAEGAVLRVGLRDRVLRAQGHDVAVGIRLQRLSGEPAPEGRGRLRAAGLLST